MVHQKNKADVKEKNAALCIKISLAFARFNCTKESLPKILGNFKLC